jgi:hypothetical protein
MKGNMQNKERWQELCAQAANEQDPDRLMELVKEINELLDEKEASLKANGARNDHKQED